MYDAIQLYKKRKLQDSNSSELRQTTRTKKFEQQPADMLNSSKERPLLSQHISKPFASLNEALRDKNPKEICASRERPHKNAFELLKAYENSQSSSDGEQFSDFDSNKHSLKNVNEYMMTRITYQKVPKGTPQKDSKKPAKKDPNEEGSS